MDSRYGNHEIKIDVSTRMELETKQPSYIMPQYCIPEPMNDNENDATVTCLYYYNTYQILLEHFHLHDYGCQENPLAEILACYTNGFTALRQLTVNNVKY